MSSWFRALFRAFLALFFTSALCAGIASAQVPGTPTPPPPGTTDPDAQAPATPTPDTQAPGAPSASQSSASVAPAPPANEPGRYNSTPALRRDFAVSGFAQISSSKVGNFIRSDTTSSGGALLSYRYTYKSWLAYEVNYGFTRYTDSYYYGVLRIPHNTHEFSVAYLLQGPRLSGFTPFLMLGGGALVFAPTGNASGSYGADAKKLFVWGIGLQHNIVNDRWGIRVQYRGLNYGIPSYGQLSLNTHRGRISSEPTLGVFYRF